MEERRKHKRLELNAKIEIERLDNGGVTTVKMANVNVTDLSMSGMGFTSDERLEVGSYYDVKLTIWTKETIDAVLEIVREVDATDGVHKYQYGGSFIGMTETDALKIEIYQIFNELT
ncbi:MAG: PilZ domain-containing protein [Eubacterium sp.]|nr:PilZ domain-containing protein [Eubacterium sp.]